MKGEGLKIVSAMMASMLVTGAAAWFAFGGGVKAGELNAKIAESPPVVVIQQQVEQIKKDIGEIKATQKENNAITQNKLETIIERLPPEGR